MKLKLESVPKRFLELTLPNGEEVNLQIKTNTIKEARISEADINEYQKQMDKKEIGIADFCMLCLAIRIVDFDEDMFNGLKEDHLLPLLEAVAKVRRNKEVDEKKSQSTKSMKD